MNRRHPSVLIARCSFPSLEIEQRILACVNAEVIDGRRAPDDELARLCQKVDAVITDYFPIRQREIEQMERCQVICQYGVGLDQIDVPVATQRGILVTHTPDYCTEEVADHALTLALCLWRKIVLLNTSVRAGHWNYNVADPIFRIRGRVFGLVGFGRIAQNLATKAQALGFTVAAHDPWIDGGLARARQVRICDLPDLLRNADIVSLHVPLTPTTRQLIGERELAMMQATSIVVNTSRGGLLDQQALARALVSGRLAGAALDVLDQEPPLPDEPLVHLPNVIVTPHAAFFSREAMEAVQTQAAEAVAAVLSDRVPPVLVNPDALKHRRS